MYLQKKHRGSWRVSQLIIAAIWPLLCPDGFAVQSWEAFEPPPDTEFDWIQLDSGEWLKGDLKVMYDQSLEFDSDKMDLQDFDFEDIIRIRTRDVQRVLVQEKGLESEVITGRIEMKEDQLIVLNNGQETAISRVDVVAIAQQAKHERDHWSGSLSLGVNLRGGNSETADANVMANLKRQTVRTRYNLDYIANYSSTRNEETANNQRLSVDANLFLTSRFYWQILKGEIYRDVFSNIDMQYSVQTGAGYYLVRNPKAEWSVGAGAGYQQTEYISVEAGAEDKSDSPYLGFGTVLDYEINSHIDYLFDYSFRLLDDDSGTYTHHLVTTLSTDLIDDLDIDISLVWDRIQEPTADLNGEVPKQDDYQLIFSLAYEF